MKNIISSFLFVIGLSSILLGQEAIGVKFGGNASSFNNVNQISMPDTEGKTKLGATGGINMDFALIGDWLSTSPELFFIQNGSKDYLQLDDLTKPSNIINMDYMGIRLPLKVNLGEDKMNGISIFSSLYADYTIDTSLDRLDGIETGTIQFSDNMDKVDYGFSLGMEFVTNGLMIQLGYTKGVKDIEFYLPEEANGNSYIINNNGLTIAVGYISEF